MTVSFFSPSVPQRNVRDDLFTSPFDHLLRGCFVRPVTAAPAGFTRGFQVDVREEGNQYLVDADLPGLKKDDIEIEIDGAQVSIRAQYKAETPGKEGEVRVVYRERRAGSVARTLELPAEIDQDAASAKYEDGVLRLTLPKKIAETRKLLAIH